MGYRLILTTRDVVWAIQACTAQKDIVFLAVLIINRVSILVINSVSILAILFTAGVWFLHSILQLDMFQLRCHHYR